MRIIFIGAHPDDPEFYAGGLIAKFRKKDFEVRLVSVTNGDAGHHAMRGPQLAERRRREAFLAGGVTGAEYLVLNNRDGRLQPTMEVRDQLIGMLRQFNPDLILTHRPIDYHPDHRATSMLVQDASYLLIVPSICPQVTPLRKMPVIAYMEDHFTRPLPFQADVVVDIDNEIDEKIGMLHCHASQVYEWLPYTMGIEGDVPDTEDDRREWLGAQIRERSAASADRFRMELAQSYGETIAPQIEYAEAVEICEYGRRVTPEQFRQMFGLT